MQANVTMLVSVNNETVRELDIKSFVVILLLFSIFVQRL
jgi:hypothetical protein